MKSLNWRVALELGISMALLQLVLAVGSYLTGCAIFGAYECSVDYGVRWILNHPVFPDLTPKMMFLGSVFGAFFPKSGPAATRNGQVTDAADVYIDRLSIFLTILIVALLVGSFALWGVPELSLARDPAAPR